VGGTGKAGGRHDDQQRSGNKAGGKRAERARAHHETLLVEERALWAGGLKWIAGLDEAGAGPLAGPVTAGCVVLDPAGDLSALLGVDDSKKLSPAKRAEMAVAIRAHALAYAVADATVEEIDRLNIRNAGLLAMERALAQVQARLGRVDHLLVDARTLASTSIPQTSLIKGDARSLSIAAASILAKVHRDTTMCAYAAQYPHHGFDKHKGYGTAEHQAAIAAHGVTPIHRRSFEPIQIALGIAPPEPQGSLFAG
jgi:ribonuclease HII